ncbi:MAG: FAD:protein FMN transferase [Clostridia bacterium]|nr:FAD:protein FMN transferase [Clostridia bacterium]
MNNEKKKSKKILSIVAVVLVAGILFSLILVDYVSSKNYTEKTSFAMATVSTYKIWGKNSDKAVQDIIDSVNSAEKNNLSKYSEDSEIFKLNSDSEAQFSDLSVSWLKSVLDISEKSEGAFDPTIGALTDAWGIGTESAKLPDEQEIKTLLSAVDYSKIRIIKNTVTIGKNQNIDLGAVGKGIACDIAKTTLRKYDCKEAVIAFGGSILLYGDKSFDVGIRNPLGDSDDILGIVSLSDGFVSTSGNYERTSVIEGKTYHHILDTKTGYPSDSDLLSVTVFCDNGLLSDALSTACYVLGKDKGFDLLEKYNAYGVFVDKEQNIYLSDELKDNFRLKDSSFKVAE